MFFVHIVYVLRVKYSMASVGGSQKIAELYVRMSFVASEKMVMHLNRHLSASQFSQ